MCNASSCAMKFRFADLDANLTVTLKVSNESLLTFTVRNRLEFASHKRDASNEANSSHSVVWPGSPIFTESLRTPKLVTAQQRVFAHYGFSHAPAEPKEIWMSKAQAVLMLCRLPSRTNSLSLGPQAGKTPQMFEWDQGPEWTRPRKSLWVVSAYAAALQRKPEYTKQYLPPLISPSSLFQMKSTARF
jgi:hypothetical protein